MEAIRSWIADAFARENEALTRALQVSLCNDSSASENRFSLPPPPPPFSEPEPIGPAASRTGNSIPCLPSGRIAKRKARPSKRSPATFIIADPADFRRMVQEVTGLKLGEGGAPAVRRGWPETETERSGMGRVGQMDGPLFGFRDTVGPGADGPSPEFDPFPCFPRLESWGT